MIKFRLLFFIFLIAFLTVIVKLFYIQVIKSSSISENDYLQTRRIIPERGKIYDRNEQSLVLNQNSYLLYVEPKKITDKEEVVRKIDSVLGLSEASIEAMIDESRQWVPIKSGLTKDQKNKLVSKKINSIGFDESMRRYYPESSLSAHLLGFVGKNEKGEDIGYFGIEGYYNKDLSGLSGLLKTERDLADRPIFIGTQEIIKPENGRDLVLTIDKAVQAIAKKILLSGLDKYQARQGCIIVADPKTMEILALTCLPDFDIEKYYLFSEEYFKDPAISDLYEPGSIFKPLVMAAAIEEKAVKPNDTYNEDGPVDIGEYSIHTWDDKYQGKITMTRILEKSSNVGMVYIGQKLGDKKLYQYLKKYGFGETTGIDLQGETSGYIKNIDQWYPIDYATATFGQGIVVTPIQIIRAFSSIVNGGYLLKPHIVLKMRDDKNENKISKEIVKRVISERTSAIIRSMLVSTVENAEAKWDRPKGYKIGGKTGTAQIAIKGHYDATKTNASFIGFAPAADSRFIALVILKEPKSSPWGSETAAPMFFDLAKELLVYYNISPDK